MPDKNFYSTYVDIPPKWIRGIHADGTQAKKQAVEIDRNAALYLFPNYVLKIPTDDIQVQRFITVNEGDRGRYVPHKLPLPGTREFNDAAKAAVASDIPEELQEFPEQELRVPRKHIAFPPAALRATKQFEEAIHYALQLTSDGEKFAELQHIFKEFGYYYPYWITTGGRFVYKSSSLLRGSLKKIIQEVFRGKMEWEAFGGDPSLLYDDDPDIDGWLESTATHQVLIARFDINPVYDLLEDEVVSEVQRIYKMQHHQQLPRTDALIERDSSTTNALIRLARTRGKIGVAKGVHFGGSLSGECVVELADETDITKWMKSISVTGEPRVECMVRHTILGSSSNTHAFLPNDFMDGSEEESGFLRAAMAHHIEMNSGELQSSTHEMEYFVMYVTYRELVFDPKCTRGTDNFKRAVTEALGTKSNTQKYKELQKVFGRFGYFYPSSISLGGRMVYKALPNYPSGVWSPKDGIKAVDAFIKKDTLSSSAKIDCIGGGSVVAACQDWINSIKTNQARIQFRSLRPIYELLEDEQREQVLQIYDSNPSHIENFPKIPKGLHFDGMEAVDQAIEFTKDKTLSKMITLRHFSGKPSVELVKRNMKGFKDIENTLSLDIEEDREFPGSIGFVLGSVGAYKERNSACTYNYFNANTSLDVAYVTYKEFHLYDKFIQPTSQFKEAINNALLVGKNDLDTYAALQDTFQRFGYYYPSSVQIGGRIAFDTFSQDQEDQHSTQGKDLTDVYEDSGNDGENREPLILDITQSEEDNQDHVKLESGGAIVKSEQRLSKETVTSAVEKSLAKSKQWNSIGGDSVALLSNDIKSWINTVESNQTVTQRRGLKPMYELLDKEQRDKVQQTYENVILEDNFIRYDYLVELTRYDDILKNERNATLEATYTPTEPLFEKLLVKVFPDSNTAIKFCHSACTDYGFSVTEGEAADGLICIYCSRSAVSGRTLDGLQHEHELECESLCQWGVMLFRNEVDEWQFQKLPDEAESTHNHAITTLEAGSCPATRTTAKSKSFIKLAAARPADDQVINGAPYVRYGDLVYIHERAAITDPFSKRVCASDHLREEIYLPHPDNLFDLKNDVVDSGLDSLWKIVHCPLDEPHKTTILQPITINCAPHDSKQTMDTHEYVRSADIVVFESQAALKGPHRLYLSYFNDRFDCVISKGLTNPEHKSGRWDIRHASQHIFDTKRHALGSRSGKANARIESIKKLASKNKPRPQYELGQAYMYGRFGLDIDKLQALNYLQLAANQGQREAFYELGNLFWADEEYQKALDMYTEAALLLANSVYDKLGDIYRTGYSTSHYSIPQNQKAAFMYYSIGGIFGDTMAALKIAEGYEKGIYEDFGTDHNKALRWYEYVINQPSFLGTPLAVGRVKNALANSTKDTEEANELRQEAYKAFEEAAMLEPYAKFMIAMYNLNGWGCQYPDPVLGFEILLSLIESGVDMVLLGIARCYEHGIGVECDLEKASVYRKLQAQVDGQ